MYPTVRTRSLAASLRSATVFVSLLVGLLYLVLFEIDPGGPMRGGGAGRQNAAAGQSFLSSQADALDAAAGNGNVALHVFNTPRTVYLFTPADLFRLSGIYYYSSYQLYPRRVVVGRGDTVINSDSDLFAPEPARDDLQHLGVTAVAAYFLDPADNLVHTIRPVP